MPSAEYAADTATTTSTATEAAHAAIRTVNRAASISRIDPAPEPSNVHGISGSPRNESTTFSK